MWKSLWQKIRQFDPLKPGMEHFLLICVILLMASVLLSQLFLGRGDTRASFTDIDQYEGTMVDSIHAAMTYGELELTLKDARPSNKIKILINGEVAQTFREPTMTFPVLENSLVEISGVDFASPFSVEVSRVSDNIDSGSLTQLVRVDKNIVIIGRILFH